MTARPALHDRLDALTELRRDVFFIVLAATGVPIWLALLLGMPRNPSMPAARLAIAVAVICGGCFFLRNTYFRLTSYLLVIGLWLCNALAVHLIDQPFVLYLFSLLSMVAGPLLGAPAALAVTLASSVYIVSMAHGGLSASVFLPVFMAWFALLATVTISRSLFRALEIAWGYQSYAARQLHEVRAQRGELARLTKALQDTRHDLERANDRLRDAYYAAEEARRLKAQFAANISHELRTPINLIVGFSEMMVKAPEAYKAPLPAAYRADMHAIYRNARHLQSLINDVLDVAQIDAGRMVVLKEEVNPREVILETVALARDLVENRGLALSVRMPDHLPTIWLDRVRIRQVILNLLSNAVRFTEQGGVTLSATLEAECLRIAVADTGIGIEKKDLDRVFEQFHQLDGSLARRWGGTGLGLALSKQFVRLHGGQMWAESEGIPGRGSTFYLTLPLEDRAGAQRPQLSEWPAGSGETQRSFVVLDEDPAIVQLFERYAAKHRALGAHSLEEAGRLVASMKPTALVVDDTQTVESAVSVGGETTLIRCPMPSGRRAMRSFGVKDYLVKPVSREALLDALKRLGRPVQTVLVVDDDYDIVRMFSRMLEAASPRYDVLQAYSGQEGLALMRRHMPDAVVLDLLMPDVDGFAVIEHMKADPELAVIPVVVISARGAMEAIIPSVSGMITIDKPAGFRPTELVQCVEAIVDSLTPASEPVL